MTETFFYCLWSLHILLEVIPISSSGHITLFLRVLQKREEQIPEYLDHLMHIPSAIVSALFLFNYGCSIWPYSWYEAIRLALFVICADVITGICYRALKIKPSNFPIWLGFLVTALLLFSLSFVGYGSSSDSTFLKASIIGLAQGCALLPGISRLGATFVVGCWLGLSPAVSFLFSLVIQLPLIGAAVSKALYKLSKKERGYSLSAVGLASIVISSFVAYKLLEIVYCLLVNGAAYLFGWYMLIPLWIAYKQK